MLRRLRLPLFIAAIALVAACDNGPESPMVGKPAPEARFAPLRPGGDVVLSNLKGRVVLLDFWATWCGPCRQLMPIVSGINEKFGPKGLVVMGVTAENRDPVQAFHEQNPQVSYPFFLDRLGAASVSFHADSLPTTVLIDKQGQIVYWDAGVGESTKDELEAAVQKALEG